MEVEWESTQIHQAVIRRAFCLYPRLELPFVSPYPWQGFGVYHKMNQSQNRQIQHKSDGKDLGEDLEIECLVPMEIEAH
jgi:hypothetical protein